MLQLDDYNIIKVTWDENGKLVSQLFPYSRFGNYTFYINGNKLTISDHIGPLYHRLNVREIKYCERKDSS